MKLSAIRHQFESSLSCIYQSDEIQAFFFLALAHFLSLSKANFLLNKDMEISEKHSKNFTQLITKLEKGVPIQYLLGEAHFFNLKFLVNPSVLIPRPETEELVFWVLETLVKNKIDLEQKKTSQLSVFDIGTGTGCIAISIKKNRPETQVFALDVDLKALETAKKNAQFNEVGVEFYLGDIQTFPNLEKKIHVIVSNPPYILHSERAEMHQNVLENEPHLALFVEQDDPLYFYRIIAYYAINNLVSEGYLFFEINGMFGKEMVEMLESLGFCAIELKKDMQGTDRMIRCQLP